MIDEGELFGRGMAFPPRLGPEGRFAWSSGAQNIRECIRVILLTEPGERVMLREFGGGLRRFLFMPNVVSTHRLIEETITQAVGRWEPRAQIEDVQVEAAGDDPRAAIATIRYTLVANRAEEQLGLRLQLAAAS
jgi:phage baseplate assembly protein W